MAFLCFRNCVLTQIVYSPCDAVLCSTGQLVLQNRSNMMVPGGQKTGLERTDVDTN